MTPDPSSVLFLLLLKIRIGHRLVDLENGAAGLHCTHSGVTCMTQPEQARFHQVTHVPATSTRSGVLCFLY
jgi:hypothetical protein